MVKGVNIVGLQKPSSWRQGKVCPCYISLFSLSS